MRYLLIIIAVLGFSCNKDVITLDPRALDFIDFKFGSYWVYDVYSLDSIFLRTDSISVQLRQMKLESEGFLSDKVTFENLYVHVKMNNSNHLYGCCYNSYDNNSTTGKWGLPFFKLNDSDSLVYQQDSVTISDVKYYDIIVVTRKDKDYLTYFARNYGVVYYYDEAINEFWVLRNSFLIQ